MTLPWKSKDFAFRAGRAGAAEFAGLGTNCLPFVLRKTCRFFKKPENWQQKLWSSPCFVSGGAMAVACARSSKYLGLNFAGTFHQHDLGFRQRQQRCCQAGHARRG
jgi:hypothetical protein